MSEHQHSFSAVLEDVGPCKKRLKVEVAKDEVARDVDARIEDVRKSIRIDGFRPGKVPRRYVEKNFKTAIEDEVKKHLVEHSLVDALKEKGIDASKDLLGDVSVENVKFSMDQGLAYEVTLRVRPRFELKDYKGIKVEVTKVKVLDDEVEKQLEELRKSRGELRPVEDPAAVVAPTDTLTCDMEVWLADEYEAFAEREEAAKKGEEKEAEAPKPEGEEDDEGPLKPLEVKQDVEVKLEEDLVDDLEVEDLADAFVGLKLGEWGEAETQLPVDYKVSEGRNEAAVLRLKVTGIKRVFLPELTDEWAKASGHESVEELRREVREGLFRAKEVARDAEAEKKVVDAVLRSVGTFDVPQDFIEGELEDAKKRRETELQLHEQKSEEDAKKQVEDEREDLRADVERSLRLFFVIDELARREKIRVGEADVEARIARIAAASSKHPSEVKKFLSERGVLPQLQHDLLTEKARAFLREHAQVVEEE